ncbi:hypothetical protein MCOR25_002270, partial [Pyricularia grisea]
GGEGDATAGVDGRDANARNSIRDGGLNLSGKTIDGRLERAGNGSQEHAGSGADEGESDVDLLQKSSLGGSELTPQAREYSLGLGQELDLIKADSAGHLAEDRLEVGQRGWEAEGAEELAKNSADGRDNAKVENGSLPGNEGVAGDQRIASGGLEIKRGGNGSRGRGEKNGELGEVHVC